MKKFLLTLCCCLLATSLSLRGETTPVTISVKLTKQDNKYLRSETSSTPTVTVYYDQENQLLDVVCSEDTDGSIFLYDGNDVLVDSAFGTSAAFDVSIISTPLLPNPHYR
ncbi:MAG: hypothetical protein LIP02_00850 [Bacteroidales bacterium]|nr:hypothetical protein [Bacteroidales bacterium]